MYDVYESHFYENDIDDNGSYENNNYWNYYPYEEKEQEDQLEFDFMKN